MKFYTKDEVNNIMQEAYNMGQQDFVDYVNESYENGQITDEDYALFNRIMQENKVLWIGAKSSERKKCLDEIVGKINNIISKNNANDLGVYSTPTFFESPKQLGRWLLQIGIIRHMFPAFTGFFTNLFNDFMDIFRNPKSLKGPGIIAVGAGGLGAPITSPFLGKIIYGLTSVGSIAIVPKSADFDKDKFNQIYSEITKFRKYKTDNFYYLCRMRKRDTILPIIVITVFASQKENQKED